MSKELRVAKRLAIKAGKIILKDFNSKIKSYHKGKNDIVTDTDYKVEKYLIKKLNKKFPDHGIVSEESKPHKKKFYWIIDPLDGTINFSRRIPYFGVNIALATKDKVLLGVTYNPLTKELFWAEKKNGTFLNGKRIKVSKNKNVKMGMINSSTKYIKKLPNPKTARRFGSSAIIFTDIAKGIMDADIISKKIHIWDFAPGALMVEEAGGKVTDLKGKKWSLNSKDIVASNGKIHKELLKYLKK